VDRSRTAVESRAPLTRFLFLALAIASAPTTAICEPIPRPGVAGRDEGLAAEAFVHEHLMEMRAHLRVGASCAEGRRGSESDVHAADSTWAACSCDASIRVASDTHECLATMFLERSRFEASFAEDGANLPGSGGESAAFAEGDPILASATRLDVGDASSWPLIDLHFTAARRALIESGAVIQMVVMLGVALIIALAPSGASIAGSLRRDEWVDGAAVRP
jgi:hypothetical protein